MNIYKIANLAVAMQPLYQTLSIQSEPYKVSSDIPADMTIDLSDEFLEYKRSKNPHLSLNDCEYIWKGFEFYKQLPMFGGIMIHSSCIEMDGNAYLFSAPCGTGKSTHTMLWKKYFGDRVTYINDDKPAVVLKDGCAVAYGTPFSGKTDNNNNISAPIRGICLLERGEKNSIERIGTQRAISFLLNQTFRPREADAMSKTLEILDGIFANVPVYTLKCDMSYEAVMTSYNGMNN